MRAERLVLDTNILISASLTPGRPFQVLQWVLSHGVVIFSDATFEELATRLKKPKFDRYVGRELRDELLADLQAAAEWISIAGALHACRDPDDDKFLETALAGRADCIVTGDADLLALDPFESIAIKTASGFLDLVST